eukprot:CAMPEP_0202705108 /NCGR_PEP_ID=MMETSP1385-20130828/17701_1 /ASSEMBLY_ACC=CAM_ASM_000861 /TAXON_ID=933848 /ORGANISM="Elphidium margaritaceum" /LENGTH=366 /DNA_ID=CAMNT_0049363269 /DNA_START=145 /DNA_END=1245 /DNA_ORIENTATION=+
MSRIVVEAKLDKQKAKKIEMLSIPLLLIILLSYGAYQVYRTRTEKTTHSDIIESNGISVPYIFITASANISRIELQDIALGADRSILSRAIYQTVPDKYEFDTLYTETVASVSKTEWVIYQSLQNDTYMVVPPDDGTKLDNLIISILAYSDDYDPLANLTADEAKEQFFDYLLSGLDYGIFWMANTLESLVSRDDTIEDKTISSGDMRFALISSVHVFYLQLWEEIDHTTDGPDSIYYVSRPGTEVTDLLLSRHEQKVQDLSYLINLEFVEVLSGKKYVLTTNWIRGWTDTISDTLAIRYSVELLIALITAKLLRGIQCGKNVIYKGYTPNYYVIDEDLKKKLDVYLAEKGLLAKDEMVDIPDALK